MKNPSPSSIVFVRRFDGSAGRESYSYRRCRLPTAEINDPTSGAFTATAPHLTAAPSTLEAATLLADGRGLLTGAINICYQPQWILCGGSEMLAA
jgi:hypothetical protein